MKWFAQAPANIALIKYMGKKDQEKNIPLNSSLSYTVDHLQSFVEIEDFHGDHDLWEPLDLPGGQAFSLTESQQQRFLDHLQFLKEKFSLTGHFVVRSCNNFPTSCGLASSASSFAALTRCAVRAFSRLIRRQEPSTIQQAELSRHGSGSSCRSFFSPWCVWQPDSIGTIDLPYNHLIHQVVIMDHDPKSISSREAHRRVETSPLYADRAARADSHLVELTKALKAEDWQHAYQIVWAEFQDMHELFHTAENSFSYLTDETKEILNQMEQLWLKENDGPLVTMDAGPNIHLLYRPDQLNLANRLKQDFLLNHDVI